MDSNQGRGKKDAKGILRSDDPRSKAYRTQRRSTAHFDEMNILETLHPEDKDYGHMKIDEAKTPYSYGNGSSATSVPGIPLDEVNKRLMQGAKPKAMESDRDFSSTDDDEDLSPEEKAKRRAFKQHRKDHYNEYLAAKMARQLLEEEDDDDRDTQSSSKSGKR